MTNEEALYYFLLGYDVLHIFGTYENLLTAIVTSYLPTDLLIIKFFEYIKYKGKTIDELYEILSGGNTNFSSLHNDMKDITKFMNIIDKYNHVFKDIDNATYADIQHFIIKDSKKENKHNDVAHIGQPLVDPINGRPHLTWKKCYYQNCGKEFKSALELVNHLIMCNTYTQGYHYYHELAIYEMQMTPEKVISENMLVCPSYACNHAKFDTPQHLIDHLVKLGLEPFWSSDMMVTDSNDSNTGIDRRNLLDLMPKLYNNEQCIICLDDKPMVITGNCRHHVYCLRCFDEVCKKTNLTNQICPICKIKIDIYYPFSL